MRIPTFREAQAEIAAQMRDQGYLAVVLVDLGALAQIEKSFGGAVFRSLREQVDPLLEEMRERFRSDDVLTRDESEGDRFLLFVGGPRRAAPFRSEQLRKLVDRLEEFLSARVGRLALPYLRERPQLGVGYGVVLWSPLESPERQVLRLVDEAKACAEMRARLRDRDQRERLVEIIQNREIWTAFQPIVSLATGERLGWEALSRGPRGSEIELPLLLFGRAARYGLVEELERACRRQAFVDWQAARPDRTAVREHRARDRPRHELHGPRRPRLPRRRARAERGDARDHRASRDREPEPLPRGDALLHDLGFSFAIDDVGAGHSGLETVAVLKPAYLKIDIGLVRDVHLKRVSQQVLRAIMDMGDGLGATVIAEGIQTKDEYEALSELGVRWGQGYYLARPVDPYAEPPTSTSPPS